MGWVWVGWLESRVLACNGQYGLGWDYRCEWGQGWQMWMGAGIENMNEGEGFGMSSLCLFFGCKYAKIIKSFKYFRVKYPSKFIVDYI